MHQQIASKERTKTDNIRRKFNIFGIC